MKRLVLIILTVTLIIPSTQIFAQKSEMKFGHVNVQQLMSMMPERDSARQELQEYNQMLQQEMQAMQQEYTQKLQNYQENVQNYSESIRQSKEKELQDMQRRIQEFQQTAQQDFQQKQSEILQPIMQKVESAIKRVGERNNYIYIFDTSAGAVVYKSSQSEDVMPLVKQELGIQ
jgi:outer membrane protein